MSSKLIDLTIQRYTPHVLAEFVELNQAEVLHWLEAVFTHPAIGMEEEPIEITLRMVDKEEMQMLNHTYRQKQYPTNVLSFPNPAPPEVEPGVLGDIVICAPVIEEEAQEQKKSLTAHLAHMVVHSTLHLLGYDHEIADEAEHMEHLETEILTQLAFPAPYGEIDDRR